MTFRDKTVLFNAPKIMGVLNVTPDSFSDGGKYNQLDAALLQTERMISQGATFIDVGGESTRPGAEPVALEQELKRVIPVIEAIAKRFDVIISIDTSKAEVMRQAANAGASLINDVRALSEPGALEVAADLADRFNIPSCIMHMQGSPSTMQLAPEYESVVDEIIAFFRQRIDIMSKAGFKYHQIMLDPGFGFGKTLDHNYSMLKNFVEFTQFDLPVLAGMSRKSMISKLLNVDVNDTLAGGICVNTVAALAGASVLRVHDVKEAMDVAVIIEKLNQL
ncbi:dihydropteroate synthase [Glaciecola siphonariae]|uniref:Dihydropteroate synthase n=1 Tax=Glaciecola siphonariae TaxID=521012 RepID=A0ABV9LSD7_9ALTE